MKIDFHSMGDGETRFHFEADPSTLALPEELVPQGSVVIDGVVTKTGSQFVLKGTVMNILDTECSRCLELFPHRLRAPLEAFCTSDDQGADHHENTEFIRISHTDQNVDLTEIVREAIILATPLKPLCHEECRGLCPRCGANLNKETCECRPRSSDPRWSILEALRE